MLISFLWLLSNEIYLISVESTLSNARSTKSDFIINKNSLASDVYRYICRLYTIPWKISIRRRIVNLVNFFKSGNYNVAYPKLPSTSPVSKGIDDFIKTNEESQVDYEYDEEFVESDFNNNNVFFEDTEEMLKEPLQDVFFPNSENGDHSRENTSVDEDDEEGSWKRLIVDHGIQNDTQNGSRVEEV